MNTKCLIIAVSSFALAACSGPGPSKKAEGRPLIARAALIDECPNAPNLTVPAATESGVPTEVAKLAAALGTKIVDEIAQSIVDAAAADAAAFTVTGSSPEFLYKQPDENKVKVRGCLIIAVGPYANVNNPENPPDPCKTSKTDEAEAARKGLSAPAAPWLGAELECSDLKAEPVVNKLKGWGIESPLFYAEVALVPIQNGPNGYVKPAMVRAYYPAPVSDRSPERIKDVALSVQGVAPTAGLEGGKAVFSIGIPSSWLRPKTDFTARKDYLSNEEGKVLPGTFGHWFAPPLALPGKGATNGYSGPVNLQVTFTEVPDPKKWLKSLAAFVEKNREKAKSEAKEAIELALSDDLQEKKAREERAAQRTLEEKALNACTPLKTALAALTEATKDLAEASTDEETADAKIALGLACTKAQNQFEATRSAWSDAKLKGNLCYAPADGWPVTECKKPD